MHEQLRQAEIAEKMARFEQMQQEVEAARHDISQMSETKAQVEEMFRQGFLFR
jgi:predicted nuclease with TOPRIM domain